MPKREPKNTSPALAEAPAEAVRPLDDWPPDEFTGHAGRFVRDPETGVRRRADEPATDLPNPAA